MRKCVLTLCLLGGLLAVNLVAANLEAVEKAGTTRTAGGVWHHSYAAAYFEAKRLGLPLVVHVYTDWCGPCRQMEATVLNTSTVKSKLGRSVVGVKINADNHADLVSQFGVSGFPADIFVGPNGKILFRSSGFSSSQTYASQIARAYEQAADTMLAQSDAKSADPEAEPALSGYSPVAIINEREWMKGSSDFAHEHDGVVYHLQNAAELSLFKENPEKYIPGLAGNDPLELSMEGREVPGDIRFGVFFRGRLFLLNSDENRKEFMSKPQRISDSAEKSKMTDASDALRM